MQRHLSLLSGGIAAAAVLLFGTPASHAAVYTYNQASRTVNAGILLFDSTSSGAAGAENPTPYVFYILNQRTDVKPIGWNIVNPLAPRTVTQDILNRWNARTQLLTGNAAATSGYQLGQQVTPDMAPYWEVSLSKVTAAQLRKFDILLITPRQTLALRERDKELLRQYVDAGGQILIDAPAASSYAANAVFGTGNFITDLASGTFSGGLDATLPYLGTLPFLHPVISSPNKMTLELNALGFGLATSDIGESNADPFLSGVLYDGPSSSNQAVVLAGQLGAGQIVVESAASADAINDYTGPSVAGGYTGPANNQGAYCGANLEVASVPDLKLLSNIISWSGAQTSEFHNAHGDAYENDPVGASVRQTWSYAIPTAKEGTTGVGVSRPLPGAAIYGRYAVTMDAAGWLHCFDVYPAESLSSSANPDDGSQDYSQGTSYDELWSAKLVESGAATPTPYHSAPTIATLPNGTTVVFVELADGEIREFNLLDGTALASPNSVSSKAYYAGNPPVPSGGVPGYAPAPVYYRGFLFAGLPDGRLFVYSFVGGTATHLRLPLQPDSTTTVTNQYVTASPSVFLNQNGITNDLMVVVPTNRYVYTVYAGSYGDVLTVSAGATAPFSGTATRLNKFGSSGFFDTSAPYEPFDTLASGFVSATGTSNGTHNNSFTFSTGNPPAYADYFADFTTFKVAPVWQAFGTSQAEWSQQDAQFIPAVSTAAIDNNDREYFTVTETPVRAASDSGAPVTPHSTLVCAQLAANPYAGAEKWRFRLPSSGVGDGTVTDADGISSYSNLTDFVFSGAPVVDKNGFVYAVAYHVGSAGSQGQYAVLCFNGNQSVTADLSVPAGANEGSITPGSITQPVPSSGSTSEFGPTVPVSLLQIVAGTNYTMDGNGHIVFSNFASSRTTAAGGATMSPNIKFPVLSEPQPVLVSFSSVSGGTTTASSQVVPLHTNLVWMCIGNMNGAGSTVMNGMTVVGDYGFFGDDQGTLYRIYLKPQNDGMVGGDRTVDSTRLNNAGVKEVSFVSNPTLGSLAGIPSASNGTLLISGSLGIAAYQNLGTLGADTDRVFEADADGNLLWAVDGTTKNIVAGGAVNGTGKIVTSKMSFRDPASVSQLDANSYLAADTGNNRVVEFDRAGNVINEITRFNDPNGLLVPGQPNTLNHPTSLRAWRDYNSTSKISTVHYLIADTGNYRIVQISDDFNSSGALVSSNEHRLDWVSHTYDRFGRKYAYTSADLYYAPNGTYYVAALIGNVRVGPLTSAQASAATAPVGQMGPVSGDSAGGTIVFLDYSGPATGCIDVALGKNGYALRAISDFLGYTRTKTSAALPTVPSTNYIGFDVLGAAVDFASTTPGANATVPFHLHNPRFLQTYTSQIVVNGSTIPIQDLLIADDNGAFDLTLPSNTFQTPYVARWGMLVNDYHFGMQGVPAFTGDTNRDRSAMPFVPSSLASIGSDKITLAGGSTVVINRYLISQSAGQGDVNAALVGGQAAANLGGEIFMYQFDPINNVDTFGGYSGHTLSRPSNGGALEHPVSASQPIP